MHYRLAFLSLLSKFSIYLKISLYKTRQIGKYFIRLYFRYYHFYIMIIFEAVYYILYRVFRFIYNTSFKYFIGDYFKIRNYLCKKLIKSFWYVAIIRNDFFNHYLFFIFFFVLPSFSIKVIFERVLTLSSQKRLAVLQNVLLSVTSIVLILPKNVYFAFLRRITQKLDCLLYDFLSASFFVFKNLFLRRDHFIISLVIVILMEECWFTLTFFVRVTSAVFLNFSKDQLSQLINHY